MWYWEKIGRCCCYRLAYLLPDLAVERGYALHAVGLDVLAREYLEFGS